MIKGVSLSLSPACLFIIALEMLALTASFHLIARPMGAGMSGMKRLLVLIFLKIHDLVHLYGGKNKGLVSTAS